VFKVKIGSSRRKIRSASFIPDCHCIATVGMALDLLDHKIHPFQGSIIKRNAKSPKNLTQASKWMAFSKA